jgi:hypothetical protein
MRRAVKSPDLREHVTWLHELHRAAQMGERIAYSENILAAANYPSRIMSSIGDGMDGNHSNVPWFANLAQFGASLKFSVQAHITHGRRIKLYVLPPHVKKDANVAVHCALLELRQYFLANGNRFPETWYHQMDGGPENANVTFLGTIYLHLYIYIHNLYLFLNLGMIHYLVAKGLISKAVLSRLVSGHSHSDPDGVFGVIWQVGAIMIFDLLKIYKSPSLQCRILGPCVF